MPPRTVDPPACGLLPDDVPAMKRAGLLPSEAAFAEMRCLQPFLHLYSILYFSIYFNSNNSLFVGQFQVFVGHRVTNIFFL